MRVTGTAKRKYMQMAESFRSGGTCRHRILWSMGRYEAEALAEARRILRDMVDMSQARAVIAELEEVTGPVQGKHYFRKFGRSGSR